MVSSIYSQARSKISRSQKGRERAGYDLLVAGDPDDYVAEASGTVDLGVSVGLGFRGFGFGILRARSVWGLRV